MRRQLPGRARVFVRRLSPSPSLQKALSLAILVGSLGLMVHLVVRDVNRVTIDVSILRLELISIALVVALASNIGTGVFWRSILAAAGGYLSLRDALSVWFLSNPTKYGLGVVSQFAGRVYLAERAGAPRSAIVISLFLEIVLIVISGLAVVLSLGPLSGNLLGAEVPTPLLILGPLVALVSILWLPNWVQLACGMLPNKWQPGNGNFSAARLRESMLVMMINWLLFGTAGAVVVLAMTPLEVAHYLFVGVAVVVGILVGFAAIVPLGLGVREVITVILLSHVVPAPIAVSATLLHRLLTIIAELLCAGTLLVALAVKYAVAPGEKER